MTMNNNNINLDQLKDMCNELNILSNYIFQTYLTNQLNNKTNAGTKLGNALYKLFKHKVFILNDNRYIHVRYNIHQNDKFNIKIVVYLLGKLPNNILLLSDKYLDQFALWKKHISMEEAINIATTHEYFWWDFNHPIGSYIK